MIIRKIDKGWLVNDVGSVNPPNAKYKNLTINTIFNDIINSKIIKISYSTEEPPSLIIVRKKTINTKGINKTIKETVVLNDYEKMKEEPSIKELKKEIDNYFNNKLTKKLPKFVKKIIIYPAALAILFEGYNLYKLEQKVRYFDDNATTTVDKEKEISEVLGLFNEYCNAFCIDDIQRSIIYSNILDTLENSDNKEKVIIESVYNFFLENLYNKVSIQKNESTEEDMELFIVRSCKALQIDDPDIIYTMLAVHKLETLNGTSNECIFKNNLGNIKTSSMEIKEYPNAQVGAIDFIYDFMKKYEQTYDTNNSIEYNLSKIYSNDNNLNDKYMSAITSIKIMLKDDLELEHIEELLQKQEKIY